MFKDRKDAAIELAHSLADYKSKDVIVLGIPKGGIVPAFHVAQYLEATFSLIIVKKLAYSSNPEVTFGSVGEAGSIYLNEYVVNNLSEEFLDGEIEEKRKEIAQGIQRLRFGRPLPDLKNKIVILVDDGIATGASMFAAVKTCQKEGAGRIVVAAPASGAAVKAKLEPMADEIVILGTPVDYFSVSQVYWHFPDISYEEVVELMNRWEQEQFFVTK